MKSKFCTKCRRSKSIDYFPNNKNTSDGKHCWCKSCQKENTSSWYNKNILKRPWINSYNNAKQRCNNKNNPNYPWWGGRGIKFCLTQSECEEIWNRDKAYEMAYPTIDRIDNDGDYTYNNCQFLENIDNSIKDSVGHRYKGKYINYYKIGQYDKNGKLIKIWNSQGEISKKLGISQGDISHCVNNNKVKTVRGFIFKKEIKKCPKK